MMLVVALFWFAHYVFVPYFTPHMTALGIASTTVGVIVGTYGFSQLLLRIPFGITADRIGSQKLLMLLGCACLILAGIILRVAEHPAVFLLGRFLSGVSASTWVNFTVFFSGLFSGDETGRAMGTVMAFNNMGMVLSYAFGMLFFDRLGIRGLFLVSIAVAAVALALLLPLREERKLPERPMHFRDVLDVLRNPRLLLNAGLAALMQVGTFATAMSFTANHAKALGAGGFELGLVSILFSATGMLASFWTGTALRRKIPDNLHIAAAFALMAVYCVSVPNSAGMAGIYLAQLPGGFGRSIVMSLTMSLAIGDIPAQLRSTAMGAYQSIYGLGMTLGPVLMGAMLDVTADTRYAFYMIGAVSLVGTVWSFLAAGRKKESPV